MQLKDIYNQFTVNDHGIIEDTGKFEGCLYYIPYYWNLFLNGCADNMDQEYIYFDLTEKDFKLFPELKEYQQLRVYEDKNSFINCELL